MLGLENYCSFARGSVTAIHTTIWPGSKALKSDAVIRANNIADQILKVCGRKRLEIVSRVAQDALYSLP